jgi:hypothetical protein
MINNLWRIIKGTISDIIDEIYTLIGLFAGWLVLTGSAKVVIGKVIMIGFIVWIIRNRIKDFSGKE